MATNNKLTFRERATIKVLFFIVKLLNPTGYSHEVQAFQKELEKEIENEA